MLIELFSSLLKNGIDKNKLYDGLLDYHNNNSNDDETSEEIEDLLTLLSGYHNPYVTVDENGINIISPVL